MYCIAICYCNTLANIAGCSKGVKSKKSTFHIAMGFLMYMPEA